MFPGKILIKGNSELSVLELSEADCRCITAGGLKNCKKKKKKGKKKSQNRRKSSRKMDVSIVHVTECVPLV